MPKLDDPEYAEELDSVDNEQTSYDENKGKMSDWTFYKSGWRPALGWLSVLIILYAFIVHPLMIWFASFMGYVVVPPDINAEAMINLVAIVIGIGAMRTYEKVRFNDRHNRQRSISSRFDRPRNPREPRYEESEEDY